ncbi:hypothetical protein [Staphylococcus ureilyticus]|uniref:hypothetical protein n=1 Tax=Staphylococcus ureilyticus TaxID=94138 RepID=UPI0034DDC474
MEQRQQVDQGNYTVEIPSDVKLDGGENIIVTSKDKDGNTSEEATTTVKDTTAPSAPTVNGVTSEEVAEADSEGNYTVEIPSNVDLEGGED